MEVILNHIPTTIQEPANLYHLLNQHDLSEKKGIAVAVNNKVIARHQWNNFSLCQNDVVTVIKATQGG